MKFKMGDADKVMGRIPRRSKKYIDSLLGSKQLSGDGLKWLITATDPFHDTEIACPGYPDMSTSRSITQCYQYTVGVSKPESVTTGLWDCHLPFIPCSYNWANGSTTPTALKPQSVYPNGLMLDPGVTIGLWPGYNVITCPTGVNFITAAASGVVYNDKALSYPAKGATGHFRLVGAGMEVHNTTAELYKGGSLTVYRQPSANTKVNLYKQGAYTPPAMDGTSTSTMTSKRSSTNLPPAIMFSYYNMDVVSAPVATQGGATINPSSRTWAAEDGCYTVATMSNMDNPFKMATPGQLAVMEPYNLGVMDNQTPFNAYVTDTSQANNNTETGGTPPPFSCCQAFPFDTSGAMLIGLNANSSLQVTVRYFIERIPTTVEADLLSLARPAPAYDALAMEIYSRAMSDLPVGVPVGENPLGEWFTSIVDTISQVGPKIGKFAHNIGTALGYEPPLGAIKHNVQPTAQKNMSHKQKAQQGPKHNMQRSPVPNPPWKKDQPKGKKKKKYTAAERAAYNAKKKRN